MAKVVVETTPLRCAAGISEAAVIETELEKLARDGGPPALGGSSAGWPLPDDDVRRALETAWADGSWGLYHGPHSRRLEERLARLHDVEFVTLTCSGTFAVELALRGLGIASPDEVILAGYDFPGNFRAVEAIGARVVLVDVEPDGWLLDIDQLPAALGPRTRAIVVSHLHGGMCDMPRVMEFAARHSLAVVEDACQSPGAQVAGRVAGSWGDAGVLSFGGSKLLTSGRGGAVLTRSAEVHQRAKIFSHRGNNAFPLSELQAAILLPQWDKLEQRNAARRASVERLQTQTANLPGLRPIVNRAPGALPSYYKLAWRYVPEELSECPLDAFLSALQAEGAPFDRGFRGFALRTVRRCRKVGSLPNSRRAAESTLLLHHPILLDPPTRIDALAQAIAKVTLALARHKPT